MLIQVDSSYILIKERNNMKSVPLYFKLMASQISSTLLVLATLMTEFANSMPTQQDRSFELLSLESGGLGEPTLSASPPARSQNPFAPRPMSYVFDSKHLNPYMQIHKLSPTSNNITCNDGSQVGYYIRQNVHSKSWIIYLQGGGFCGSEENCQQRWQRSPHLMSSNFWPKTKTVEGILSSDPKDNPYLWNANHVYIPYCSSDSWSGLAGVDGLGRPKRNSDAVKRSSSFSFMGSKIIERILDSLYDDLPFESSLNQAKFILLAGDSAGATGVILNLDKVNRIIDHRFQQMRQRCSISNEHTNCDLTKQPPLLRGLADSGWFLDNEPYDHSLGGQSYLSDIQSKQETREEDCDHQRCGPLQSIKQAMQLWNGQVPRACQEEFPTEPWRCYFGYRTYQTLKTPLFVVQWLYDEAQLLVDNIAKPDTSSQWDYVSKVVSEMRASLENVTALFAPSCLSHSLITRPIWNQININGLKLPHVLNSWEEQSLIDMSPETTNPRINIEDFIKSTGEIRSDRLQIVRAQNSSVASSTISRPILESSNFDQDISEYWNLGTTQHGIYSRDADRQNNQNFELRSAGSYRQASQISSQNRPKGRKKRRNNQQTRGTKTRNHKLNQPQADTNQPIVPKIHSPTSGNLNKDPNDVSLLQSTNPSHSISSSIERTSSLDDSSSQSRIVRDSSGNGRQGRSTVIEETTQILSNNVPEQESAGQQSTNVNVDDQRGDSFNSDSRTNRVVTNLVHYQKINSDSSRFRLIDSCDWPQCNRDCPILNLSFNTGISL